MKKKTNPNLDEAQDTETDYFDSTKSDADYADMIDVRFDILSGGIVSYEPDDERQP